MLRYLARRTVHGLAVLFVSGYSGADVATRGLGEEPAALRHKPFTAGQLPTAVRAAIHAQSAARVRR